MPLRKVLLFSASLSLNAASFVNVTARRLHVRKMIHSLAVIGTLVALDQARSSIDEVPTDQSTTNDSRSHISDATVQVSGISTNGALVSIVDRMIQAFNRNDLVLDPDEALFMNNVDGAGTPTIQARANIWYED